MSDPTLPTNSSDPAAMYRAAEPHLQAALEHYQGTITGLLRGKVPEHYVIGRVKTARSLIRKLRSEPSNPRSWESITDKVGVRVICTTKADCIAATQFLQAGPWDVLKTDRKKPDSHNHLFYPGTHIDLVAPQVVDHTGDAICCEVQIRTRAQDAWAVASHKLSYKGALTPPKKMQRLIIRLTVFVEVFDDEIHRLFKKRAKIPDYAAALALEQLEDVYEVVSGEPAEGAKDLSLMLILRDAYSEAERQKIPDLVVAFSKDNSDLATLIQENSFRAEDYNDRNDWLFTQPEVLMVLERAAARPYRLVASVRNTDLEDVVRATCITAGHPLPGE